MNDIDSLTPWIQPKHLQPDTLLSYRESFARHPARLVLLRDFLQPRIADYLGTFLREQAEWQIEYGLFSVKTNGVCESEWLRAPENERFFRYSKLVGSVPSARLSPNALTYLRFRKAFQEPQFRKFFESLCGFHLGWSDDFGSHSMKAGDFLKPHDDNNRNRRIALVIYLSDDWEPRFGGSFNMIDREGHTTTMAPEYNSMVVFDVGAGTKHFVDPITAAAGTQARVSIGGWYHRPEE